MTTIRQFLIAYLSTAVIFLALDAVWLSITASRIYRPALGHLMSGDFLLAPAAVFYALYIVGMVVFAVAPSLDGGRWITALGLGALLGLVAYATYDLTNQSTLRDWPLLVTVADLCWGTLATATAAALSCLATNWLSGVLPGQ
jgi:uncharacterized membrane protein